MKQKALLIICYLCMISFKGHAQTFLYQANLKDIAGSSVYALCQDKSGAIWLGTNEGLYRNNGNTLEYKHASLPYHPIESNESKDLIYVAANNSILRYNCHSNNPKTISTGSVTAEESAFCANGDSLLVGWKNSVYVTRGDSLMVKQRINSNSNITSIRKFDLSRWLVGMDDGTILITDLNEDASPQINVGASVLCMECHDDEFWIGTAEGAFRIDRSFALMEECRQSVFKSTRAICFDNGGNIFMATPGGLVRKGIDGSYARVHVNGSDNYAYFSVITDWNGDIWAGTLLKGCFYANITSFPFLKDESNFLDMTTGIVKDSKGDIWAFTDANGLYRRKKNSKWELIDGTLDSKYQFAYYDTKRNVIWTSEYKGNLLKVHPEERTSITQIPMSKAPGENVWCVEPQGDTLFIGTTKGIYIFEPEIEKTISRKIEGFDAMVRCLMSDGKDHLYIGTSHGVYLYSRENNTISKIVTDNDTLNSAYCSEITRSADGHIAIALLGRGVVIINSNGTTSAYNNSNGYLTDNNSKSVYFHGTELLIGGRSGLSIINLQNSQCYNFYTEHSVRANKACFVPESGGLIIGGQDGVFYYRKEENGFKLPKLNPSFDHIYANGIPLQSDTRASELSKLILSSDIETLSIDFATFNYPGILKPQYEYRLEGYGDWTTFNTSTPISFSNIPHRKYTLKVREHGGGSPTLSMPIILRPVWYATRAAKVLFFLIILATIITLLRLYINHSILEKELEMEKKESKEKVRFFVNLSQEIRTPMNLMIGQLEKHFRDYGSRSPGIDDLEEIYTKAGRIRKMVTDYVDSEVESEEKRAGSQEELRRAADTKFLNAATAVVEKNLFTENVNLTFLCKNLNIGRTTLAEKLRQTCGMTPHEFIEDIRMRHAAQMVLDGNKRIGEIANDLRYSSPRYFSDCFKKKYGCIPSEYKKKS